MWPDAAEPTWASPLIVSRKFVAEASMIAKEVGSSWLRQMFRFLSCCFLLAPSVKPDLPRATLH